MEHLEARIEALTGQLHALNSIVAGVIQALPREVAAQTAVNVAASRLDAEIADAEVEGGDDATPPQQADARNRMFDAYHELLLALAQ